MESHMLDNVKETKRSQASKITFTYDISLYGRIRGWGYKFRSSWFLFRKRLKGDTVSCHIQPKAKDYGQSMLGVSRTVYHARIRSNSTMRHSRGV